MVKEIQQIDRQIAANTEQITAAQAENTQLQRKRDALFACLSDEEKLELNPPAEAPVSE